MEKKEKKTEEFFGTDEQQVQQMESQSTNELFETTDKQPEKKHTFRGMLVFLLVAVGIGVPAMLINMSCHQKKENQENYVYAYGEEPSEGHVSFKKNKSNIINPSTKEIIVEDIDWCHYSSNSDEDPIVLFAKKGKRGFCNIVTNEVIVEPTTYTKVWPQWKEMAISALSIPVARWPLISSFPIVVTRSTSLFSTTATALWPIHRTKSELSIKKGVGLSNRSMTMLS